MTHVSNRTGAIICHALHDDCSTAQTITLVADLVIMSAIGATGTAGDCALDVVFRHVGAHRLIPGHAQTRVCLGIGTAGASCNGNFTDNFGPKLPALGVLATFSVLDIGPFTVSGHSSLQIVLIMVHFTLATI